MITFKNSIALFVLICCLLTSTFVKAQTPVVNNGIIDLTNIDFDKSASVELRGDWDFYWENFVIPTSVNDTLNIGNKLLAPHPGTWTKVKIDDTHKCSADGFATYRVRIKVKNIDEVYGLKMHSVFSAYKLYLNNELVESVGVVGKTREDSEPQFLSKEIPVPVSKLDNVPHQIIDIVVHVSNFHHRRAGLKNPISFGSIGQVGDETKNSIILHLLIIGIILIIGVNHVLMYLLRRLDASNLMFGILCVIMILRDLTTGERIITHWFPNMNWELLVRLDNFSGFATITLFAFYFYYHFKREFPKTMLYITMGTGIAIAALVFSTSAWFYGQFRIVMELYVLLGGLYLTFGVLMIAAFKKRQGAFMTFIGMFILYATAINDVLSSMGIVNSAYVAPYGIVTYMMIQSFLLTRKSAFALKDNQNLSAELSDEKMKLEERIKARTEELTKQAAELGEHKKAQDIQNWVNNGLNKLSEIMRQDKDNLEALADKLLAAVVKEVDGTLGALYFLMNKDDDAYLKLLAQYGLNADDANVELHLKEGLTGQVFSTGLVKYLSDLPNDFFQVSSGLGQAIPSELAVIPMIVDQKVIGVIEVATFKTFTKAYKEFMEKGIVNIAAQLNIIKMNADTQMLLSDYKSYEHELREKEDEFRRAQEELQELREQQIL